MIRTKINVEEKIEGQAIDCPPDPERIVEGLRDTGYNFNTAIDNIFV